VARPRQLDLFGSGAEPAVPATGADAAVAPLPPGLPDLAALRALAARLPPELRFGTCSWAFPGWTGLVYASERRANELAHDGLAEYARHPLLRTVEIDRSYYAPIPAADFDRYASQLPPGFRCALKAPAAVTSIQLPHKREVRPNPDFLNAARLEDELIGPAHRALGAHLGPLILEFPAPRFPLELPPRAFAEQLDEFLGRLPTGFDYAVELRHLAWMSAPYRQVLARHRVAHVCSYWSHMPRPAAQERAVPMDGARFLLIRLLLPPGARYEAQKDAFEPFDRLHAPDPAMRREVVALCRAALARGLPAWVLVNNKAEGSSPLTVRALAEALAGAPQP
jgi:uncharacterized protein YecE (DUF72 family)